MKNTAFLICFCLLATLSAAQPEHYITVIGEASMHVRPDVLYYRASMQAPERYPGYNDYDPFDPAKFQELQAEQELKAEMAKRTFLELLARAGIPQEAIIEDPLSVKPAPAYGNSEIIIRVEGLERLLGLVELLRENQQYSGALIKAEYLEREEVLRQLRLRALGNAKTKAAEMARALGSTLGPPLAIVEWPAGNRQNQDNTGDYPAYGWASGQENTLLNIMSSGQAGESLSIALTAKVEVRFLLKD